MHTIKLKFIIKNHPNKYIIKRFKLIEIANSKFEKLTSGDKIVF